MERKKGKYDFLIVGSGLFGAVFAHKVTAAGKSCLVVDKRSHVGGKYILMRHSIICGLP